jgi:hypothetical protein
MATALPKAEVPLLTMRMTHSTMEAALLPVPSLISSSTGTLLRIGKLLLSFYRAILVSGNYQTYPVALFLTALRSVMENPSTRIHTTPTKNCEIITISRIRGRWRRGWGISSAKWVGPSKPISVAKLLNRPSTTERPVESYLFMPLSHSQQINGE